MSPIADLDWIVPDQIAALGVPTAEDLAALRALGCTLLVSLLADRPAEEAARQAGLRQLRLPVENLQAPAEEQIREFVAEVKTDLTRGGRVAVHCLGGYGRTGTLIACYLVSEGSEPSEAIDLVRRRRPGSIETYEQESAIFAWAATEARRSSAQ